MGSWMQWKWNSDIMFSKFFKTVILIRNCFRFIQLIFFTNSDFIVNEYGMEYDNKIILLIKPGHYNIGIKDEWRE